VKDLPKLYKNIVDWNKKAGSRYEPFDTVEWWSKMELQSNLLKEESSEVGEAVEYCDAENLLAEACDVFVIWSYLANQLEKAGYDVQGAIEEIGRVNNTKIFNTYSEASDTLTWYESKGEEGYYIEESYLNNLPYYTVRNKNGKVVKPKDFVKVVLKGYVPK